ncbi:MAG: ABC transporter permease [Oscillospiraceae bacterium]|nr:ABC transporter permease [Oscillospiraceae bacterium]
MAKIKEEIDIPFLMQFSIDDFKNKYAGSFMGVTWAFIQPLMTIIIYWFIFQIGFKSQPVDNYPFILWLVSGLVSWFFISECITGVTSSLVEYSYLVKKVVFNINLLPLVRVLSCLLVQIFLVVVTVVLFAIFGYFPDTYYLQLPYYMVYMVVFMLGIGYCTAALYPFFKDLLQIVNIAMQFIFWLTPIVWDFEIMPKAVRKILVFNPFYYIVSGYRNIFVYKEFFWNDWKMGIYYWIVALLMLVMGRKIFKKMKIHFADVL